MTIAACHRFAKAINHILLVIGLFVAVLFLGGCATQKAWQYKSEPESSLEFQVDKTLAVPAFLDQRTGDNSNMFGMYLIPIVPFGWQEMNTPEGAQMHMTSGIWFWKPNEDIAKATAEELNKTHIFKEAFFTNRASEGDLVLEGTIESTKYNGKIISYGLSAYGPLLWLIGLPASTADNELILRFKLEDKKSHSLLWEKEYHENTGNTSWIYYLKSDFEYADMLKKILLAVVKDIQASVTMINSKLQQQGHDSITPAYTP
jgi:hypothetical protein